MGKKVPTEEWAVEKNHQSRIFKAMAEPEFYPHPVAQIATRETHISKVFLTGTYAYKIKKPVDLDFLDFTTLEKRHCCCEQEVELNRRLTRDIYLAVTAITFDGRRYRLGGPGKVVEYTVKMHQLPEERSLAAMLAAKTLDGAAIEKLARHLAVFYEQARTDERVRAIGSWETVRNNCEENFRQIEMFSGQLFDRRLFEIIRSATRAFLQRKKSLFHRREAEGKIRDCHGDLKPEHVYFTDGIQIVDCIEFNQRFRYADVTADLAFLTMAMDYAGFPCLARQLLHAYVRCCSDWDLYVLLDFYKCYRAVVRAKITAFRLREEGLGAGDGQALCSEIRNMMAMAYDYAIQFTRPTLWVICGLPASGKSTVAAALGDALGIPVLHSDTIRKAIFGLPGGSQRVVAFQTDIYSREASALTYGQLLLKAQEAIEAGRSVILDATYGNPHDRAEVSRLATDMDANLFFIECRATDDVIKTRLRDRETLPGSSDARIIHFQQMKERYAPMAQPQDAARIQVDTARPLAEIMAEILSREQAHLDTTGLKYSPQAPSINNRTR